jgi:ABC-type Mn2+/Zn2+ transport system ATPase subunit
VVTTGHDSQAEIVLEAHGLELGYDGRTVLRGVDLRVRSGEFWFLLGPNGSGKSTLLNAILGLIAPLAGSLALHRSLAARDRIGFTPQTSALNPTLPSTVREFVSLGAVGLRLDRRQRSERLAWALARLDLGDLAKSDLHSLSGGQRQRAVVARALIRRPHLMLLDEPTEGLDVASEDGLLRTLEDLRSEQDLTLLFVTHKLRLAARFATHVALFANAAVRAGGRDETLDRTVVQQTFGVPGELLLEELRV